MLLKLRSSLIHIFSQSLIICESGSESSEALMLHGVPQGSILGPLFFILFIIKYQLFRAFDHICME